MKVNEFLGRHIVFTWDQFAKEVQPTGNANTLHSLLAYHQKVRHVIRLRRGLYKVIAPGTQNLINATIDPYLIAGHLSDDAVLAYHTALGFYGKNYSLRQEFPYLTASHTRLFTFQGQKFIPRRFPKALIKRGKQFFGVNNADRLGVILRVTSLERTLVDVLDQPALGGGWEEVWRSLELIEFFDLDKVLEYALLLNNATTIAAVGLYLERHREALHVTDEHLAVLRKRRPKQPHYLLRTDRSGRFVGDWNLIVPARILDRSWEEPL